MELLLPVPISFPARGLKVETAGTLYPVLDGEVPPVIMPVLRIRAGRVREQPCAWRFALDGRPELPVRPPIEFVRENGPCRPVPGESANEVPEPSSNFQYLTSWVGGTQLSNRVAVS